MSVELKSELKGTIKKHYRKFLNHAYIHIGCKETAQDVVQEAFLSAYQNLNKFRQESKIDTWIFGILNNKILEYQRKKTQEQKYVEYNVEEILFHKSGKWKKEWLMNDWTEHEQQEQNNLMIKFLKKCFDALNEQYKKVFSLKFFADKNTQDLCKACNITPDNAWQILHRGKLQLKICIQSQMNNNKK